MPFVKLDIGVIDSTLWADPIATRIFIAALCKAEPWVFDEPQAAIEVDGFEPTGFVVPPEWYGFARVAGIGLIGAARVEDEAAGFAALKKLGEVDPGSRSGKFNGRRLVRINGGFVVLNFYEFRDRDYTTAERSRRYRERKRQRDASQRDVTASRRDITQAEAEAEGARASTGSLRSPVVVDAEPSTTPASKVNGEAEPEPGLFGEQPRKIPPCPFEAIVALYHQHCPKLPRVYKLTKARRAAIRSRWVEDLTDLDDWTFFFRDVVPRSSYYAGMPSGWRPTLDWLTKADNFAKVMERHKSPRH